MAMRVSKTTVEKVAIVSLDVTCSTEWGESVCIAASSSVFPEGMATVLSSCEETYPKWRTEKPIFVPVPSEGSVVVTFRCFTRRGAKNITRWDKQEWCIELSAKDAGVVTNLEGAVHEFAEVSSSISWAAATQKGTSAFPSCSRGVKRTWSKVDVGIEEKGSEGTHEYRLWATDPTNPQRISLWHDIPLFVEDVEGKRIPGMFNYVCEVPRCTRRKYEIATTEIGNPIKQDTAKDGSLREYRKGDIFFNYGCMPRTWEDPNYVDPNVGVGGDNDPLDVCEIGLRVGRTGETRAVKVLGVLCMIDAGEADWKVIAIDADDQWAEKLNDIADVERLLPGLLDSIREWWRTYKIPEGKAANRFGYDEKFLDRRFTLEVIDEMHEAWERLVSKYGTVNPLSPDSCPTPVTPVSDDN